MAWTWTHHCEGEDLYPGHWTASCELISILSTARVHLCHSRSSVCLCPPTLHLICLWYKALSPCYFSKFTHAHMHTQALFRKSMGQMSRKKCLYIFLSQFVVFQSSTVTTKTQRCAIFLQTIHQINHQNMLMLAALCLTMNWHCSNHL